MDQDELRRRLAQSTVAVLATIRPDGNPHLVPVTFALDGEVVYFAVDHKPKRTTDLQRLRNITGNPQVALLVQNYEHDWKRLWWVRADGTARVLDAQEAPAAIDALVAKYPQYAGRRPEGPVVVLDVQRISGWEARRG